jgi:RNA polymerase sigma factor (sigma-70 family)
MAAISRVSISMNWSSSLPHTTTDSCRFSDALDKLAIHHKEEAELVKLRYFVGMTNEEAAEVLGISPRTAKYYWTHARAWLYREIEADKQ